MQSGNGIWSVNRTHDFRNIFIEKSYTKCVGETISRPFFKIPKLSNISGSIF